MPKNEEKIRGVSYNFIQEFKKSGLYDLYKSHKKDLFLGIRCGYINLYYNCASVGKVEYHPRKEPKMICKIHKKYLKEGKKGYTEKTPKEVIHRYDEIIKNIKKEYPENTHPEKAAQQRIIRKNNENFIKQKSNWFCVDIEYIRHRNSSKDPNYGRYDIIAISNDKPRKIALIELKYEPGALGGSSGIVEHTRKYLGLLEYLKTEEHKKLFKKEIMSIVENLYELGICKFKIEDENELVDNLGFYFLTLNNKQDKLKRTFRRYLFENEEGRPKRTITVEKELGEKLQKIDENLRPKYLFSDDEKDDIKIQDIIEDENYTGVEIR